MTTSGQVKVPGSVKRELELFAATTGRTQGSLLSDAWREYRAKHAGELSEASRWAQSVLQDPAAAAVAASGMDAQDIDELRAALLEGD